MNDKKLNILFSVLKAGLGGHVRTAVTIACGLREKGHKIYFLIGDDCPSTVINEQLFEVFKISTKNILFEPSKLENFILSIKAAKSINIIHSFENTGMALLTQTCKKLSIPFFLTLCSRPNIDELLDHQPIITLSEEFKKTVLKRTTISEKQVYVIPSRINTNLLISQYQLHISKEQLICFKNKYSLSNHSKIILRIARISLAYVRSIIEGAYATEKLFNDGYDVRFVHIGFIQDEMIFKEITSEFQRINQRLKKNIAITVQDECLDASSYYGLADIVIGTGRTAFEAMITGRPVIVTGMNGFAGLINPESVDEIAFYNFSGRNIQKPKNRKESVNEIAASIQRLLSEQEYYQKLCIFGKDYVVNKLDYQLAAQKYELLYLSNNYCYPEDNQIKKILMKVRIKYFFNVLFKEWLRRVKNKYYLLRDKG